VKPNGRHMSNQDTESVSKR